MRQTRPSGSSSGSARLARILRRAVLHSNGRPRRIVPRRLLGLYRIAAHGAWIATQEHPSVLPVAVRAGPTVAVWVVLRGRDAERLGRTLASLRRQSYLDWRVVIAPVEDDAGTVEAGLVRDVLRRSGIEPSRADVLSPSLRLGAALAAAQEAFTAPFPVQIEAGDVLSDRALGSLIARVVADDAIDMLYADEDILENGIRGDPQLKPDWSPELLTSYDYVGRPVLVRRSAIEDAGSYAPNLDGAAPWDLHLRLAGPDMSRVSSDRIGRVTEVLCHRWPSERAGRPDPDDPHAAADACEALGRHWRRLGHDAEVSLQRDGTSRSAWAIPSPPLISVVIPSRDRAALLEVTLDGVLGATRYPRIEVVIVDNGSTEPATLALYERAQARGVRVVPFGEPFNYSRACNVGAAAAKGELLLFLNNDVEVRDPDWLAIMVRSALLEGVGVVDAKLSYPNGTLQHAGVVVGMHVCGLVFDRADEAEWGPFGPPTVSRNWLGVMGACQLVRRTAFDAVGGFDEAYRLAMSDVKLCLDIRAAGWRTVCAAAASLVHHEGATRGRSNPDCDVALAVRDILRAGLSVDPYFHPGLSAASAVPVLRGQDEPRTSKGLAAEARRRGIDVAVPRTCGGAGAGEAPPGAVRP